MKFNEAQWSAITHNKGPCICLAGPGSGKTSVITNRVRYLVKEYKIDPSRILVITFTKAAALEMKQRFLSLMGDSCVAVTFGTFHAVFFTILKHAYKLSANSIITPENQRDFIKRWMYSLELDFDDENEAINNIIAEISKVKVDMLNIVSYESLSCPSGSFKRIYNEYQRMLFNGRKIDFDDMILRCLSLLKEKAEYRKAWQEKYEYILIDEFQDINIAQFDVVRILADKHKNLFVVGDDDQSIYGFRGSKPDIMLSFSDIYNYAKQINLNINYRCSGNIVAASKTLISNNKNRYRKEIKAFNESGEAVNICDFDNLEKQCDFIVKEIKRYINEGVNCSEIAILSRTNDINKVIYNRLVSEALPVCYEQRIENLYDTWIGRDIVCYLKMAVGNIDRNVVASIINKPMRYIKRSLIKEHFNYDDIRRAYLNDEQMLNRINDLQFNINMLKNMSPYSAVNYIRKGIGYDDYISEYAMEHRINKDSLIDLLSEIEHEAKQMHTIREWLEAIELRKKVTNQDRESCNVKTENKGISLLTMHSSKGLEYDIVFVTDICEGIIPYKRAVLDDEIEEERRMLYVAMTRAKKKLYLLYPRKRYNKDTTKSRFIEELLEDDGLEDIIPHCPHPHITLRTP